MGEVRKIRTACQSCHGGCGVIVHVRDGKKIFQELGKKMEQEKALDYLLEPAGLTWEEFKEKGYLKEVQVYYQYKDKGFSTPTTLTIA